MKWLYVIIVMLFTSGIYGQTSSKKSYHKFRARKATTATSKVVPSLPPALPRESVTEKYLKGDTNAILERAARRADTMPAKDAFVKGISETDRPTRFVDSATPAQPAARRNARQTSRVIEDTVVNVYTAGDRGLPTNSGAVDKSGQVQFGQTNWGDGRSTIGEGQWTVPPPVTGTFTRDFPAVKGVSWSQSNRDSAIVYRARYQMGNSWVVTSYNTFGQQMDSRTELPVQQAPHPVALYLSRKPVGMHVESIYKIQVPGKPDVYELRTKTGDTLYINDEGLEVNY